MAMTRTVSSLGMLVALLLSTALLLLMVRSQDGDKHRKLSLFRHEPKNELAAAAIQPDQIRRQLYVEYISNTSSVFGKSYLGPTFSDNAVYSSAYFTPADPSGAVSNTTLVDVVNAVIEIRSKNGGGIVAKNSLAAFFAALHPVGDLSYPKVVYDEYEDRFVVAVLELTETGDKTTTNSRFLLAVSYDGSPSSLDALLWNVREMVVIEQYQRPNGVKDYLYADFPGMEVGPEAIYITANMNSLLNYSETLANRLWILNKTDFYNGADLVYGAFDPFFGDFTNLTNVPTYIHGGPIDGGVGTYLVAYDGCVDAGLNCIYVTTVYNPLGSLSFDTRKVTFGNTTIDNKAIAPRELPAAPQLGSTAKINVGFRHALDAVWRENELWVTTTVVPRTGRNANQTTAFWIRIDTNSLTAKDFGEIGGEDIAPQTFTFHASVAVNSQRIAAFGFSASGPSIYPGAYAVGRSPNDAPGTVSSFVAVKPGVDYFRRTFGGPNNLWGDYSAIVVDPSNDTFWAFNEFASKRGDVLASTGPQDDGVWGTAWLNLQVQSTTVIKFRKDVCFSEANTVETEGKGVVAMKDLQIGDKVKDANGNMVHVYSFGHYHPSKMTEYLQLHIKGIDRPLEISKDHLVFVNGTAVPASSVLLGDKIDLVSRMQSGGAEVHRINRKVRKGAYAPFTTSGTIMVSGVAASCYVTLQKSSSVLVLGKFQTSLSMHWLEHIFQSHHRFFCYFMGMEYCRKTETYNHDGISNWAEGPYNVFTRLEQHKNGLVMAAVFAPPLLIGLALYALEVGWMYLAAFLLGAVYVWQRRTSVKSSFCKLT